MEVKQIHSMTQVNANAWNSIAGNAYPFLRHEFLLALEQSGSVCESSGWLAGHLVLINEEQMLGFMPMYLKYHSWGEYVFDQPWAQSYHQQGLNYYPKWLSAIPFTPCQGSRILAQAGVDTVDVMILFINFIKQQAEQQGISSWHCLFPELQQLKQLRSLGLSVREGIQYQWFNRGYRDFNDFLNTMNASKRKMLKRERRRVSEQGIKLVRIMGTDVSEQQWQDFFRFYSLTYLKRNSEPYLNLAFFQQIADTMGEQLLLILAFKDELPIAAALSFIGDDTLYGRYWGCYDEYHSLHFEACYYQGLDYCIKQGLQRFDSGAQGEHKIARGFEPVTTYSAHWLRDERFALALESFLEVEQKQIQRYKEVAKTYLPFK